MSSPTTEDGNSDLTAVMDFTFSRDECLNLESSLRHEWLETDGLGGYAASTILDCHTRKYHGLLVVPVSDANGRFVLLSKVEAAILVQGNLFRLSTNKYPGVFNPTGHKYIEEFHHEYHPTVLYRVGDILLRRSVMMVPGEHTVMLKYELTDAEMPITLRLQPLLAYRNIHDVARADSGFTADFQRLDDDWIITPNTNLPPLHLDTSRSTQLHSEKVWLNRLEYLKERSRGFPYQEDLLSPGVFELEMEAGDILFLRASLQAPEKSAEDLWNAAHEQRGLLQKRFVDEPRLIRVLKARGEQFMIRTKRRQQSIVAGYPWFWEWGRDAMIALPGLTLHRGCPTDALAVLTTFAGYEKDGLLPNIVPIGDDGETNYNAVDASLWFFWTIQKYLEATGDEDQVRARLFPKMQRIINAFAKGIAKHVTPMDNGLIWVGDENTQLTWMDARVDDKPVTPRHGMAVELNALWYNALCFYEEVCQRFNKSAGAHIRDLSEACRAGFIQTFWNADLNYLMDVVNNHGIEEAVRPNQMFAVSLPHSPLSPAQQKAVMQTVTKDLQTPYGLRTLSPGHPSYCPIYHGTPAKRDKAYHQGTVWPWLTGHYVEAELRVSDDPKRRRKELRHEFMPLFDRHLREGCLGSISEIFNADPPHTFKGCFAQAWSVAEIIRAWDLLKEDSPCAS